MCQARPGARIPSLKPGLPSKVHSEDSWAQKGGSGARDRASSLLVQGPSGNTQSQLAKQRPCGKRVPIGAQWTLELKL